MDLCINDLLFAIIKDIPNWTPTIMQVNRLLIRPLFFHKINQRRAGSSEIVTRYMTRKNSVPWGEEMYHYSSRGGYLLEDWLIQFGKIKP